MAQNEANDVLKNDMVKFSEVLSDGETVSGTYMFPQPGMLPNNFMYGFKRVRDFLWVWLSRGEEKNKVVLLIADKKMMEFRSLSKLGERDKAIDSGNEALDKLEYASKLIEDGRPSDEMRQLRKQVLMAGLAYEKVVTEETEGYQIDSDKFTKLTNRIDAWNKEQDKKKFDWKI